MAIEEESRHTPEEVTPPDPSPAQADVNFELIKISYEKSQWTLALNIHHELSRLYMKYDLKFYANEEGFDASVRHEESKIHEIETEIQQTLIETEKKKNIQHHKNRIKDVERERAIYLRDNETIELFGSVREMKRNVESTRVVFIIPNTSIEALNSHRLNFSDNYLLELQAL